MAVKGLSSEAIQALLTKAENPKPRGPQPDVFYKHGFDRSCLFLLELNFTNLFEPHRSKLMIESTLWKSDWWFRCKGCGRVVKRTGRESHHSWHKRELLGSSTVQSLTGAA